MNGDPRKATAQRPYGEAWVPVSDIKKITTMSDADRWTGGITLSYAPISIFTHRATFGLDAVNVKGKTHERVDAVGEGRAIEVHAVALLLRMV